MCQERASQGRISSALLLGALFCVVWWGAFAGSPATAQTLYSEHYGLADGLPSREIRTIDQDADGRLWIGTRAGVSSYDGREWSHYGLARGLSFTDQFALRRDPEGGLWTIAGAEPFPIYRFEGDAWVEMGDLGNLLPGATLVDFEVTLGAGKPVWSVVTARSGVVQSIDGSWRRVGPVDGPEGLGTIHASAAWRGSLWLATEAGLAEISQGRIVASELDDAVPSSPILAMAVDSARLWLVAADWIGWIEGDAVQFVPLDEPSEIAPGAPVVADGSGSLYYSTAAGLRRFHLERGASDLADDPTRGEVRALFVDRESSLWIGSDRGLTKVPSRQFFTFTEASGTFADGVVSALEQRDGTIVLGHRGGLTQIAPGRAPAPRALPLSTRDQRSLDSVRDIAQTADGTLWLAVGDLGVLQLSADGALRLYGPESGIDAPTAAIAVDGETVWVGTREGVLRLDLSARSGGGRLRFVEIGPTAPEIKVRRLLVDDAGGLMIAADDGLYRFDGTWRRWGCRLEPGCSSLFSLFPRPGGGWWVGTAAGLYRTAGDHLVPETAPAIGRPVFFILAEGQRDSVQRGSVQRGSVPGTSPPGPSPPAAYWFGVDGGVSRWLVDEPERLERFTVEDGLGGREVQRAAALRDRDGRLWFGTEGGATVYDPNLDPGRREPPRVTLESVVLGARSLPLDRPQRLRLRDNDLRFRYQAISLIDERRVRTRVRLLGFEDGWVEGDSQEARYTNVPPGEYRFQVQARAPGSSWSRPATSAPVQVLRPLWLQPWLYALGFLGVLGAAVSIQRLMSQGRYSRRLAEEVEQRVAELRASEDRYRKTFRGIDDGVLTTDISGRVELLNPRAEQITGWTAAEAVGRPFEDILQFDHVMAGTPSGAEAALVDLRDTLGPTTQARLTDRSGKTVRIDLSISPVVAGGGRTVGLVFAFRDVGRRLAIEEELKKAQKLEAVGLLAGGIAHDFNNLLAILMGNLSLLQSQADLDSDSHELLRDAETALVRARDLTQQLLTFSRGGAPVREAARLPEVATESANLVLAGSAVKLETDFAADLWVVEIDSGQMSQVISNLLLNAMQAMPEGGRVVLTGRNFQGEPPSPLEPGRYVTLDVRDSGVGIPHERVARVFDPYFSTKATGRGLGLASSYSIVKRHEGLLAVHQTGDDGTTFRVYLPASDRRVTPRRRASSENRSTRFTGRVLLMDDDAVVRRTTSVMLERLGFEVVESADGADAVERYVQALDAGRRFDIVFTDLTVPGGLGGKAALERLKALDPDVVAIVSSGYSNDPVLADFRAYGFRGRLAKPFRVEDLVTVLQEVSAGAAASLDASPSTGTLSSDVS